MRITRKVDTSAVKADPGVVAPNTAMENMVVWSAMENMAVWLAMESMAGARCMAVNSVDTTAGASGATAAEDSWAVLSEVV